ncbi:MAG: DEAD/DEAH box helicase [Microscillaceae bacterium]
MTFADFKLTKPLFQAIEALGYTQPTPIQQKAIPLALAGHDVMGIAQTGTGKTAAYLLPLLAKLHYAQPLPPRALILAPTRELAVQIDEAARALAQFTDLRCVVLYGGIGPTPQIEALQAGADLITATPGRLMDLYFEGHLLLKNLKILVLDEADRMMDSGFMPQIRALLEVIPPKRQNLLFSATIPDSVRHLSEEFLEYPEVVEISPSATTAETVSQAVYAVPNLKTKVNFLEYLLQDAAVFHKVIVFVRTRETANNIYKFLVRKFSEAEVKVIHANKSQSTRLNAMAAFKAGEVRVLVATDVAARGIDVTMVSHVINFEVPMLYEEYVHRIGRTGRAQQSGQAITFVTEAEEWHFRKIEALIQTKIPREMLPPAIEIAETPREEAQAQAREIDRQMQKDSPDFKGAFHEKKKEDRSKVKSKKTKSTRQKKR